MSKYQLCLGLSLMMIAGCTTNDFFEPSLAPLSETPEASLPATDTAIQRHPDRVLIPKTAPWLSSALDINYQGIPAVVAIEQIASSYPIKFLFTPDSSLTVQDPAFSVSVKDHLDSICSQANWAYTVTASGVVLINDIETRVFNLAIQPGNTRSNIRLHSLGGGTASTPARGAENALTVELDPYENEVVALINSVLGLTEQEDQQPDASVHSPDPRTRVALLPSANGVVVTAPPHLMRQVEHVLSDYVATTAKSVVLHVAFFEVDLAQSRERSLNLGLLWNNATRFGIRIVPPTASLANPSNLSLNFNSGNARGSSAILNWLNTLGETSLAFEDTVEVRNNSVGSLDVTNNRQYVKSISRENQTTGAITAQTPVVEFDVLRTGWSIHLQPTITGDLIVVRIGLSRSNFVREVPYTFDSGRIAGTNFITSDYNRLMAIRMRNGETKLLASLNSQEKRQQKSRTPWLPLLGDRRYRTSRNTETVMMLSAEIL